MNSSKYATGEYIVRFFDPDNKKLCDTTAINWQDGVEQGYADQGDGSFVLLRVVYNSLDPHPTAVRNLEENEE